MTLPPPLRSIRTAMLLALASSTALAQTTWTQRNQAAGTGELLWSVAEGNAGIVAVGTAGKILTSTDAKTWTPRNAAGFTGWIVAVTYGNNRYVAVGENGTILTSTDTLTWTSLPSTSTTARLNNVLYAQDKYVAVGEGGAVVVSTNGTTWQAATSGVTGWLHGLAYGSGRWIATGQGGIVISSLDGITWTKISSGTTQDLEAVVATDTSTYNGSNYTTTYAYFLAVGAAGTSEIIYFYNTVYPNSPASNYGYTSAYAGYYYDSRLGYISGMGTTARLRSLTYVNRVLVATGENGTILTAKSPSGPWTKVTVNTTKNLLGAGPVQGTLMLVGESEAIFQSEQIFSSRLGNISTRGVAGTGGNIMIAGTVVQGPRPKQFLIRGVGPALTAFGVGGALADPVLSVFDATGRLVTSNTGWGTNLNTTAIAAAASANGAFPLASNSKDSALLLALNPGSYTFQVASASGANGVALVEAYDLDTIDATSPRAINISTRGQVGTDANILIAGLFVQGQSSRTLLIRGVGPTLGQFGVSGTLSDPIVKVLASDGSVLATNDNWSDTTLVANRAVTADDISAATSVSGAFPLAAGSKDAALLMTLVPGSYTIQVSGVNNATGVAIVEAYDVPSN